MPRPGPRPYECVRRAWHSERHNRMRGSIIQKIFRVVFETHSSATKNNKEWLEKMPIVVYRAEEIMYSKANSEAEYLNPDTLWERLNDAVNTIIRRDESTETGELLPPCVEAALNLGCKPVRASRSERHNNPRTYLPPRTQEHTSGSSQTIGEPSPRLLPLQSGNPFNVTNATATVSALPIADSNRHAFSEGFSTGQHQPLIMQTNNPLNLGSVYPLYYGSQYGARESELRINTAENTSSDTILVGTPVIPPSTEPDGSGLLQNFSYSSRSQHVLNRTTREAAGENQENSRDRECDLSLRLGPCSHPSFSSEKGIPYETEHVNSRGSQEGIRFNHQSLQMNGEFCFYPRKTGYDPFDPNSTKGNFEGEDQNPEINFRKRKAP